MRQYQVALVDDHRLFRNGMASLIGNFPEYIVSLQASNGKEFIQKISKKFKPDIVLLDLDMPEMDGIATTDWLHKNFPEIHVIILSMFDNSEKILKLVEMGIKGYLLKDSDMDDFKRALDTVSKDDVFFPSFVTKHMMQKLKPPPKTNGEVTLNKRETEFLIWNCSELTYKEIADKMCISIRTVDGYRDQLFEKLQIKNRVGLVLYAIKHKLVEM
ncbi:response regulator [Pedobacter sp. HMF7647]|uniref:Response regulator n=1 Tax=Hufsiella arboris TaxID=2695275 RepID=A0A7K1YDX9_9SPHI|nr:response regulator transcription factor [Hufsiella arboris]MXV52269.1 response regulator [Hufsiella arboris]